MHSFGGPRSSTLCTFRTSGQTIPLKDVRTQTKEKQSAVLIMYLIIIPVLAQVMEHPSVMCVCMLALAI